MAKTLLAVGCVGAITDGGVRDIAGLLSVPFAVSCNVTTLHHGLLRSGFILNLVETNGIYVVSGDLPGANTQGEPVFLICAAALVWRMQ